MEQLTLISEEEVVKNLRRKVFSGAREGVHCPCCDRMVKEYRRALNADQARFLVLLCREYLKSPPHSWVDIRAISVRGGDYAKTKHWGLAEQSLNEDPTKRSSGLWRPTPSGLTFARGESKVPSHVYLLDNAVRGFSEERIDIWAALGKRFDFRELWYG